MGHYDEGQFEHVPLIAQRFTTYGSNGGVNVIKTGPGFLKEITISQMDAAPTAGEITIYDDTVIYGSTNILFKHSQTTAVFMPVTVFINAPFNNGLSLGFLAALKDVSVLVKYK